MLKIKTSGPMYGKRMIIACDDIRVQHRQYRETFRHFTEILDSYYGDSWLLEPGSDITLTRMPPGEKDA